MLFLKEIATLKATVADLQGQLALATDNTKALLEEKAKLEGRIGELEAAQTDAVAKVDHEAAILLKDGEIETLKGQLKAAEKNVDLKVVEKIAEAGVPAARRDPAAVDSPVKTSPGNGQTPQQRLAAATKVAGGK